MSGIGWRLADYAFAAREQVDALGRRVPEDWSEGSLAPVLLIPGVWEPWAFLRRLGSRIHAAGHPVHALPALGYHRMPIARAAELARKRLDELDLERVVVVAHSKGGLVAKVLLLSTPRVDRVIAIATPFAGSRYADYLPVRSLREFRPRDAALLALAEQLGADARITSVFPAVDPHIPGGSRLAAAHNVEIPASGHFRILGDERVVSAVLTALDPPGTERYRDT